MSATTLRKSERSAERATDHIVRQGFDLPRGCLMTSVVILCLITALLTGVLQLL